MRLRYRDKQGKFISEISARRRKSGNVQSELLSDKGKSQGQVKGFWTSIKKVQRALQPAVKIKTPRRPPQFEDEDMEDFENQWEEDYLDDFPELEFLIDEIDFEDEEEFYEET